MCWTQCQKSAVTKLTLKEYVLKKGDNDLFNVSKHAPNSFRLHQIKLNCSNYSLAVAKNCIFPYRRPLLTPIEWISKKCFWNFYRHPIDQALQSVELICSFVFVQMNEIRIQTFQMNEGRFLFPIFLVVLFLAF